MRQIPSELAQRYKDNGWWTDETVGELIGRGLADRGDLAFEVHSATHPYTGTFADVEQVARRLAAGLADRGVGEGDVVVSQLPNWMEAAATFWATSLLGAVIVPVVHFYGPKEMSHIIATTKPKVVITATGFGKLSFDPDLYRDVPIVGVVGQNFDELLADEPMTGIIKADPAARALIAFTSGTTSKAKGVIHSHQTLVCETRQLAMRWPHDGQPQITGAPTGHFIGMVSAFLIPILEGYPIHLIDVWDPAVVLRLMTERGLKVGGGAPYFVTSVLDHPDFTPAHLEFMPYAGLGGASVPLTFTRKLTDLGVIAYRSYGSTEHPSITGSKPSDSVIKRTQTDGSALEGVELKIAPDGEILSRGPDLCLGYTDDTLTAKAFDSDGWYHTGDIGILDDTGSLTITDRKNDVIIRGGENISAQEVEEELLGLPGVAEAAAVSAPDARLGERTAAVLRLHPGAAMPTLDELRAHFATSGLAKQKWPEELHQLDEFPRTPSGKIQKAVIRKMVAELSTVDESATAAT
ncbi:UNVERIFIED_CONTAM: acyl-CoA synthetase (AMP-forming)/AMP-acid ligase II [Williamsia faeni]